MPRSLPTFVPLRRDKFRELGKGIKFTLPLNPFLRGGEATERILNLFILHSATHKY